MGKREEERERAKEKMILENIIRPENTELSPDVERASDKEKE